MLSRWKVAALAAVAVASFAPKPALAQSSAKKPNILVLFGDDIGLWNVSAYNRGMMGYRTPNIDRIAKEGAIFTDVYAQQSCTAGRAAFITGQSPIRTGMLKVGLPGAPEGLHAEDPTIADLLKAQGYATGQFGKNHLGDRNGVHPHGTRLRRVLRQLLPPERRTGTREPRLPEGPEVQGAVRTARRVPLLRDGDREHPPRRRPLREVGQAEVRRYRPADQEADGDDRRRGAGRDHEVHRRQADGRQALVRVVQHDPHAHLHAPEAGVAGEDGPGRRGRRHGRARRSYRPAPEEAGRPARHREHHRDLDDRQRGRGDELARWWYDTVPRREEHELGRGISRTPGRAMARRDQAGRPRSTRSSPTRTGCPHCWPPQASRR